jgi:hypothetical protein
MAKDVSEVDVTFQFTGRPAYPDMEIFNGYQVRNGNANK